MHVEILGRIPQQERLQGEVWVLFPRSQTLPLTRAEQLQGLAGPFPLNMRQNPRQKYLV